MQQIMLDSGEFSRGAMYFARLIALVEHSSTRVESNC